MLLGKLLAEGALREGREVTYLPAYGAEVRGGTAYCMVVISDSAIGSPYIEKADTMVIMNAPSFHKFKERGTRTGVWLVNSSMVEPRNGLPARFRFFPFTAKAVELGNVKVANVVALGSLLAVRKILSPSTMRAVIEESAPRDKKDLVAVNLEALRAGMELVNNG